MHDWRGDRVLSSKSTSRLQIATQRPNSPHCICYERGPGLYLSIEGAQTPAVIIPSISSILLTKLSPCEGLLRRNVFSAKRSTISYRSLPYLIFLRLRSYPRGTYFRFGFQENEMYRRMSRGGRDQVDHRVIRILPRNAS